MKKPSFTELSENELNCVLVSIKVHVLSLLGPPKSPIQETDVHLVLNMFNFAKQTENTCCWGCALLWKGQHFHGAVYPLPDASFINTVCIIMTSDCSVISSNLHKKMKILELIVKKPSFTELLENVSLCLLLWGSRRKLHFWDRFHQIHPLTSLWLQLCAKWKTSHCMCSLNDCKDMFRIRKGRNISSQAFVRARFSDFISAFMFLWLFISRDADCDDDRN